MNIKERNDVSNFNRVGRSNKKSGLEITVSHRTLINGEPILSYINFLSSGKMTNVEL